MAARLEPDLADRLHKSLRVSGMEVQQLAEELGVHRNTLSRYLSGRGKPDRRTLSRESRMPPYQITGTLRRGL